MPDLPADLDPASLDPETRAELRSLARPVAENVALRLIATGELIDVEPKVALAHALVARRLAARVAAVREAVGLAAYQAGDWQTAVGELRAYHRMSGTQTHLAVIADCERALGRPERAVDLYRATDSTQLAPDEAVELLIVAAGARGDLGQHDAAVQMLQVRELTQEEPWTARLRYAYADALLRAGRRDEAREWFARAAEVDDEQVTDAAERLLDLDGVNLDDEPDDEHFDDLPVDRDDTRAGSRAGEGDDRGPVGDDDDTDDDDDSDDDDFDDEDDDPDDDDDSDDDDDDDSDDDSDDDDDDDPDDDSDDDDDDDDDFDDDDSDDDDFDDDSDDDIDDDDDDDDDEGPRDGDEPDGDDDDDSDDDDGDGDDRDGDDGHRPAASVPDRDAPEAVAGPPATGADTPSARPAAEPKAAPSDSALRNPAFQDGTGE